MTGPLKTISYWSRQSLRYTTNSSRRDAMTTRIQTIEYWHDHYNQADFNGKLTTPYFSLTRSKHTDGYFEHWPGRKKKGKIAIAARLWEYEEELKGTLLHEMVHQYQHEILDRKCNHDAVFCSIARKLERKYRMNIR
jgi:hypothetical protein